MSDLKKCPRCKKELYECIVDDLGIIFEFECGLQLYLWPQESGFVTSIVPGGCHRKKGDK